MKRRVFKDDKREQDFKRLGYMVLPNYLSDDDIEVLTRIYNDNLTEFQSGFHITQWSEHVDIKKRIDTTLKRILCKNADRFLNDYRPLFSSYGAKYPGEGSKMHLHQDWAHVDETYFSSVNIWCPLQDTTTENGAIYLVQGSHRLFDAPRGVEIPSTHTLIPDEQLIHYTKEICLKKGEALLWDHRVIHGSGYNGSDNIRNAAIVNMMPKEAEFLLYSGYYEDTNKVQAFKMDSNFLLENNSAKFTNLIKEKGESTGYFDFLPKPIDEARLAEFIKYELNAAEVAV